MLPWSLEVGYGPAHLGYSPAVLTLYFGFQNWEKMTVVLSHQVCGWLLRRPQPQHTDPAQRKGPWGGTGTAEKGGCREPGVGRGRGCAPCIWAAGPSYPVASRDPLSRKILSPNCLHSPDLFPVSVTQAHSA